MCHPYGNPARPAAPGPAPPQNGGQRGVLTSKHRNGRPGRAARFAYPVRGYFRPPGVVGRGILDAPFDFRDPPGGAGLPGRGAAFDVKSGGKTTRACGPWTQGSTAAVLCVVPHVNRACVQRARPSVVIVSALPRLGGPRRSPRKPCGRLRWTGRANSAQGFRILRRLCAPRRARHP